MNVFSRIWVVFAKEVVDNMRDRRSISMAAVYPIIGPLMVGLLIGFSQELFQPRTAGGEPKSVSLAVRGADHAPDLINYLKSRGTKILPAPEDLTRSVREGATELALVIPEDFASIFGAEKPAKVQLVINSMRISSVMAISRTIDNLRRYGREVSQGRLASHGLDVGVANPIKVESVNVGRARSLSGFFLNMIPPFIIFTVFIGGVYLALDTTSGERERGSLEPLLTNPLARWEFMLGKVAAAFLFTMAAAAIQLAAFKVMFDLVSARDIGMNVNPTLEVFAIVFLVAMPIMLFAVALQVIVATITRSFKESQTYLGLLPLIPSLPGIVMVFISVKAQLWMMLIPTFSQVVLIGALVRGDPVSVTNFLVSMAATTLVAVALLCFAGRLYNREQLLFIA